MYYTGVSREYLEKRDLKIEDDTFRAEVVKSKGLAVSRYDGRVTRPLYKSQLVEESSTGLRDDATADRWDTYFYAALNGDLLPRLNVKLDRAYAPICSYYKTWNKSETMGTTAEQLRNAMSCTPGMRTFFANGYFDVCTEFGYVWHTLDHAGLPKDRVYVKGYPSGHMIYLGEDNVHALCRDIRTFLLGKDPSK